ncbi:MAG: 50S ribosomal protein L30 [Thermoprotei archaeon]|nr:MAG: 50S ribosomal protein L30 [Thermoprotei archaeon]
MSKLLAVVRLRGVVGVPENVEATLKMLRLHKVNHATLVEDTSSYKGMLLKASGYITYGEVDQETLTALLRRRGRLRGNKPVTDDYAKKLGFEGLEGLAEALLEGKVRLKDLPGLKPVFRLHPPSGGFKKSVKKPLGAGGELGYRGVSINELLKKMM